MREKGKFVASIVAGHSPLPHAGEVATRSVAGEGTCARTPHPALRATFSREREKGQHSPLPLAGEENFHRGIGVSPPRSVSLHRAARRTRPEKGKAKDEIVP